MGHIREVVEASRIISMYVAKGGGWEEEVRMEESAVLELRNQVLRCCEQGPRSRCALGARGHGECVFVNSDAMNVRAAGTVFVGFTTKTLFVRTFNKDQLARHINEKETLAVIWTWEKWRRGAEMVQGWRWLVTGIDNKTAKRAVKVGFYPGNAELSNRILQGITALEEMRVEPLPLLTITIVFVPGIFQVADEPTRNEGNADEQKCRVCLEIMKGKVEVVSRMRAKRGRE